MNKPESILLLVLCGLFLFSGTALAHRINVFAWVEGGTVHVEGRFPGGTPVMGGAVKIYGPDNALLLEGKTDDKGNFSFPVPAREDLLVVLDGGLGHRSEWKIPADEIQADVGSPEASAPAAPATEVMKKEAAADATPKAMESAADLDAIRKVVDQALDRKLAPLTALVARGQEEKTDFRDILGGLGYILGLVGLGAYISFKRKEKELSGR